MKVREYHTISLYYLDQSFLQICLRSLSMQWIWTKSHWTCYHCPFTPSAPQELFFCLFSQKTVPDKFVNTANAWGIVAYPTPLFFLLGEKDRGNSNFLHCACLDFDNGLPLAGTALKQICGGFFVCYCFVVFRDIERRRQTNFAKI